MVRANPAWPAAIAGRGDGSGASAAAGTAWARARLARRGFVWPPLADSARTGRCVRCESGGQAAGPGRGRAPWSGVPPLISKARWASPAIWPASLMPVASPGPRPVIVPLCAGNTWPPEPQATPPLPRAWRRPGPGYPPGLKQSSVSTSPSFMPAPMERLLHNGYGRTPRVDCPGSENFRDRRSTRPVRVACGDILNGGGELVLGRASPGSASRQENGAEPGPCG